MSVRRTPLQPLQMTSNIFNLRQFVPTLVSTAQKLEDRLVRHTRVLYKAVETPVGRGGGV